MTKRSNYRYVLLSDGNGQLKFERIQIAGFDLPNSPQSGNRNQVTETEKSLREVKSGNGNSIFSGKELSL
jgi:hypothetical protein